MPSQSLQRFETKLIVDVEKLIKTHEQLNSSGRRGRRGLGYITRSGVVMLCAAWETYVEDLIWESTKYFCRTEANPKCLPKCVQKEISKYVKKHKHELKPLELAQDGWKSTYKSMVEGILRDFNTPKSTPVDDLYKTCLGLHNLSSYWSNGGSEITKFVSQRGEIAHLGSGATYVKISNLKKWINIIKQTVLETDNTLADYLKNAGTERKYPWKRRNLQ